MWKTVLTQMTKPSSEDTQVHWGQTQQLVIQELVIQES